MSSFSITPAQLRTIGGPLAKPEVIDPVAAALTEQMPAAGLADYLPCCHFLGQAAHESMGFHTLQELGNDAYFARYNNRADLGNGPHDGALFHGRGIFQLTGRANYASMSKKLGIDLIAHPERAAEADVSVKIAILFWNDRHLSDLARKDDVFHVSARINGINRNTGQPNGLAEREQKTAMAKKVLLPLRNAA